MALYDYHCQGCGANFDKLVAYRNRDLISCPDCGAKADREMVYPFSHHWVTFVNKGTQGGEGFSSAAYPRDEYKRRVVKSAPKDDVYHKDFE